MIRLPELVVKVPRELEKDMSRVDWVDWSDVALEAFSERMEDIKELEVKMRVFDVSGIPEDDNREIKESLFKDVVISVEETLEDARSGKRKPMTLKELDELMGLEDKDLG